MIKTIPCPICRGEIHAVAGRCKHCKTDLVDLRERAIRAARAHAMGATVPPRPMAPPPMMPMPFPMAGAGAAPPHDVPTMMPPPEASNTDAMSHAPPPAPPPQWGEPPAYFGPEVVSVPQPSAWSRRWPVVVSALALLAIGISLGMLAERWRKDDGSKSKDGRVRSAASQPSMVPDHMPQPLLPGPSAPHAQLAPPSSQAPSPVPDMFGSPRPSPAPGAQGGGDAGAFRAFTASLTESLCKKLGECGADAGTQGICMAFAQQLDPEDAVAKVASGECSFNQKAADACLRAVSTLRCDTAAATGMMDWLSQSQQVGECAEAYVCQ
jgi:hypothetical protein